MLKLQSVEEMTDSDYESESEVEDEDEDSYSNQPVTECQAPNALM
jgi:hypothetical protein